MSLLSPQLLAFIAIVEHKTVHAAASSIHLTQTAVTQRIKSLEQSLKTTLFIRSRRGMQLTSEGKALLRYCHAAQILEGEALANISGAGVEKEISLRISAPTSIMQARIIPCLLPVMKEFPQLLLHFNIDDLDARDQSLQSGDVDFAILQEEQLTKAMQFKRLLPEQYVLVCSPAWKKRRLKDIIQSERIIDFSPADHMTFDYLKRYDLLQHAQHQRYFVNRTENLAQLVSEGIGYTTLAKEFVMPYVKQGKLLILNNRQTHDVTPVLAWFDRPEPPAYFSAVIEAMH